MECLGELAARVIDPLSELRGLVDSNAGSNQRRDCDDDSCGCQLLDYGSYHRVYRDEYVMRLPVKDKSDSRQSHSRHAPY